MSYRINAQMCLTKDVGTHGNLFGGRMLAWMDESAAIFARTYTGETHVVTLRFSETLFIQPVKVGEIVEFRASDPQVGRTSITFQLEGRVKETSVFRNTCTFVVLDEEGKPKRIDKESMPGRTWKI
ncbi:acyl-CoA thioesterase [bacterium]|nr:acyl-CoA thioesterase [bacterium]